MAGPGTEEHPTAETLALPAGTTPNQREAITADDPVVCVLAGAGAGKTGVLTMRVARRVHEGTAVAQRTLVCTFSRNAADELRERLFRLGVRGLTTGTIHRLALLVLRTRAAQHSRPAPAILASRARLIDQIAGDLPKRARGHLEGEISWAKARLVEPDAYVEAVEELGRSVRVPTPVTASLYRRYEDERRRRRVLDLDDLLISAGQALEDDPEFADAIRWRFRHLFIDEMQDVNPAQFRLLRLLVGDTPDLFIVGDPHQSIYGWNGADPRLLDEIPMLFPGARVIRLDDNHRCTPGIVRVAAAVLDDPVIPASTRPDGPLPTVSAYDSDVEEAGAVAQRAWLAHVPGRRWSHIAVLARTNAQLRTIADAFEAQRIPHGLAGAELGPASDLDPADGVSEARSGPGPSVDDQPPDGVVLSTFHRAKGLQWPCVFVVGLSEGRVPISLARSVGALEEERRLLYVGLTRAEVELHCSWARRGDDPLAAPRLPSRWLAAIERARGEVELEAAPADPTVVTEHVARLRSLVSDRIAS
ncbi:MAG: ATP-dependent helicase [Acidimicrobiales bacterium]